MSHALNRRILTLCSLLLLGGCATPPRGGVQQRIIEAYRSGERQFAITFRLLPRPEQLDPKRWRLDPANRVLAISNLRPHGRPTATYAVTTLAALSASGRQTVSVDGIGTTVILATRPRQIPFAAEVAAILARYPLPRPRIETLFIGSSSFALWRLLEEDMKFCGARNHAFGGSMLWMVNHYYPVLVKPFRPARVVVYCGENDLATGSKPEEVLAEFTKLVENLRRDFPGIPVWYCTMKPSPARWHLRETFKRGNMMIRLFCDETPGLHYIDVATPMFDKGGRLRTDIWEKDRLHMNRLGYTDVWIPVLTAALGGGTKTLPDKKTQDNPDRW